MAEGELSVRRACDLAGLSRSAWYSGPEDRLARDSEVIDALLAIEKKRPRWGFWKCFHRLRLDGRLWNHKRVYRIYKELGLNHKRCTKKRLPRRTRVPLDVPARPNADWSIDLMQDTLYSGRRFRTFNVIDEGVREVLGIEIDTSLTGERIKRVMEQMKEWYELPEVIRCNNGPEMLSQAFTEWCDANGVEFRYFQPGKPNQSAYIERFNRTYRDEVFSAYLFKDLDQARQITWEWMQEHNEERPHEALGNLPPAVYRRKLEARNSDIKRTA